MYRLELPSSLTVATTREFAESAPMPSILPVIGQLWSIVPLSSNSTSVLFWGLPAVPPLESTPFWNPTNRWLPIAARSSGWVQPCALPLKTVRTVSAVDVDVVEPDDAVELDDPVVVEDEQPASVIAAVPANAASAASVGVRFIKAPNN